MSRSQPANRLARVNDPVRIERAGIFDADTLAAFAERTFVEAYEGGDATPDHVVQYAASAFAPATVRSELGDPAYLFLIARRDDGYAGYAKLCRGRPIAELSARSTVQLERIYVERRRQGAGLGGALLRAALAAAQRDADAIWLSVWQDNPRAQRFYRKNGFEIVGKAFFMLGPERQEDFIMARRFG